MRRMPITQSNTRCEVKRGFTLVELLVVIAIIGMLVALLIPAVGAARARMRKAACLSNMRQVGLGLIAFDSDKGRLPGYIEPVKARSRNSSPKVNGYVQWIAGGSPPYVGSGYVNSGGTDPSVSRIAWSAHILSQIDRSDIWDLVQGAEPGSGNSDLVAQQIVPQIDVYVCADDTDLTSIENAAGISYVVNTGAWDWDKSSDFLAGSKGYGDTKENGLFLNGVEGRTKTRLTDAKDGSATTLMLSENMSKNERYSWLGVTPLSADPNAFGEQQFGFVWVVGNPPAGGCGSTAQQYPFNDEGDGTVGQWPAEWPCFARPFSKHSGGGFNAVFADGHGRSLNTDLDYLVYQQLMTAHGAKCVNPLDHSDNTGAMYDFRTAPPLSESDLD